MYTHRVLSLLASMIVAGSNVPLYHAVDLGTLGGAESRAQDISDSGKVVGSADSDNSWTYAFLFDDGIMTSVGALGFPGSAAYAVNDAGWMIGQSYGASSCAGGGSAIGVFADGVLVNLTALTMGGLAHAADINNNGDVVGIGCDASGEGVFLGRIYNDGELIAEIGYLPQGEFVYPRAIDDTRRVVGQADTSLNQQRAFRWEQGVLVNLGVLPTHPHSTATAISNAGTVVGFCWSEGPPPYKTTPCVFAPGGGSTPLPKLAGHPHATCLGVNNAGVIVGGAALQPYAAGVIGERAVAWFDGAVVDLNSRVSSGDMIDLRWANAINGAGWIVGVGRIAGNDRAFLLRPVSPPDLDGDGVVGSGDLGVLIEAWGGADAAADMSEDGIVDAVDLGLLLAGWGS